MRFHGQIRRNKGMPQIEVDTCGRHLSRLLSLPTFFAFTVIVWYVYEVHIYCRLGDIYPSRILHTVVRRKPDGMVL